ncbi:MAG: tRNA (adenosine(37)-N6)-threonylcarbamoyltransferase complex ATPase subunit type 1 TsaE [Patescibacteria group bacterium]|jgi:tRNA threonylcarbamoyladenosine biosynthesis protein TsaE
MSTHVIHNLADLRTLAAQVLAKKPRVIALTGPLGAGKTTLTQAMGKRLKVAGAMTSPTYTLQHIHPCQHPDYDTVVHIDAYRIAGPHELPALDLAHWCSRPKTLVIVEWAEKLKTDLGPYVPVWVELSLHGDQRRATIR